LFVVDKRASEAARRSCAEEAEDVRRERDFARAALEAEKTELAAERRKAINLVDQLKDR